MIVSHSTTTESGEIWDLIIEEELEDVQEDVLVVCEESEVMPLCDDITIASFDIGKKNFAQYVETISKDEIEHLKKCYAASKSGRASLVKTRTPEYRNFLKSVYLTGRRVHTGVYDLRNERKEDVLDNETRKNIIRHLHNHKWLWEKCNVFVIEQQFFKPSGRRGRNLDSSQANVDALKISELLIGWLLNEYPDKEHLFFGSTNKTQLLGAPPKLKRKGVKDFCIEQAKILYKLRGDHSINELFTLQEFIKGKTAKTLETSGKIFIERICPSSTSERSEKSGVKELVTKVLGRQKLDDICDACSQCQAFKIKNYVLDIPLTN
jgi:hypothetical protein